MVIDDDKDDIEIFVEFAIKCELDIKIHFATESIEGLRLMKELSQVDILFLDVHMPKLDAFEVIQIMKADEKLKDIPIVIMSSSYSPHDERRLREIGASSCMTKSVNYQVYCDELRKVIDSS
jgi:CheY-like chemotaxis protein